MNFLDLRTAARELVGDIDSAQFTDVQVNRYINQALIEVSRRMGFVKVTITAASLDAVTTDGVGGIVVPYEFIQEIEIRWNGVWLDRRRYDEIFLDDTLVVTTTAAPSHYTVTPVDAVSGVRRIIVWPFQAVSTVGAFRMVYVGRPAVLTADGDTPKIPDVLHDGLMFYTAFLLKAAEGDYEAANFFKSQYSQILSDWSIYQTETRYDENPQVREDAPALYYIEY